MFKTELHIHTAPVSDCAHVTAEEMTEDYIKNGYSAIVITNHMSPTFFRKVYLGDDWEGACEKYLDDYRRAVKQAAGRVTVLLGMELRVNENMNDYLIYGIDEQFVHDLGNVMDKSIKELSPLIRESGALLFQAHPFRNTMTVTSPKLLDGVEAGNFCDTHDSRNEIAQMWAQRFGMLTCYGSDYHNFSYMKGAGILTEKPIKDNAELLRVLREKDFLVTDGTAEFKPY